MEAGGSQFDSDTLDCVGVQMVKIPVCDTGDGGSIPLLHPNGGSLVGTHVAQLVSVRI